MFTVVLFVILFVICSINYFYALFQWYRSVKNIPAHSEHVKKRYKHATNTALATGSHLKQAPGPMPLPFIGNLNLMAEYKVPFQGFTELSKQFGDLYTLTFGTTRCLIVNKLEIMREILNQNGRFFGGRPDFYRFHAIFGGDRGHSLALCDWSQLQQRRRNLARKHCSPRMLTEHYTKMNEIGSFEMTEFINYLNETHKFGENLYIKPLIQKTCANMFLHYMCTRRFEYNDAIFSKIVENFDEIFWEINQGYAIDFLPWLKPFYLNHLNRLSRYAHEIREFILNSVIKDREFSSNTIGPERDFTDALLKSINASESITQDTILYMLEDFIGGHSAVGNLVMLGLCFVAKYPEVGNRIRQEIDAITDNGKNKIILTDQQKMPYLVATMYEILRYTSSPIVPHVATEDSCIAGYGVTKGTVVFINNYILNTSEKYWNEPDKFNPDRFLCETLVEGHQDRKLSEASESSDSGIESEKQPSDIKNVHSGKSFKREKPFRKVVTLKTNLPHFFPFSMGKRTCIGQNLVKNFGFIMLANLLQAFDVSSSNPSEIQTIPACIALPVHTFPLILTPRS